MDDLATEAAGASVIMATCADERHPAENIIEPKDGTFWATTGLYPQEFVVKLGSVSQVNKVRALTSNVKRFVLEYCDGDAPDKFKPVFEVELADKNARLQTEVHQVNCSAKFLKFTIGSGWGDFASVHRVSIF